MCWRMILTLSTLRFILFYRYIRMLPERSNYWLGLEENSITMEDTNVRKAISVGERHAVTLPLLPSGESQESLSFAYLTRKSNLSLIIRETCDAIFEALAGEYLHPPLSTEEWENIARDFQETWNLRHLPTSVVDGKQIRIQCPKQSGILSHNYKRFSSFALLSICDACWCFTSFNVGHYGSNNNPEVLANSSICQKIEAGETNILAKRYLDDCLFDSLPYYILEDEIFWLKTWLIRPYSDQLFTNERMLHYRLSRARNIKNNTFGILAAR